MSEVCQDLAGNDENLASKRYIFLCTVVYPYMWKQVCKSYTVHVNMQNYIMHVHF